MSDTRRRVKLYALNADRQWDDRGTGHVTTAYIDRFKGMSLLVRAESDGSFLLESKIQPDTAYQKQQETLIVWSEGDNYDLALSFQERAGCDEIWAKICIVQGKDPSVGITQDIVEDDDDRFDDSNQSTNIPIELPECTVDKLDDISELITLCLPFPTKRERLAMALEMDEYIKRLLTIFHEAEKGPNIKALHKLHEIFKNIFLLNKNQLFDIMLGENTLFDIIGVFEYDPKNGEEPKRHREYLNSVSRFKEVIPFGNADLINKIHQTYRMQYLQDVVLPTPSVFEENMIPTLSSFIYFNKVEIVILIQGDDKFLNELFTQIKDETTEHERRRDLVLFLKEFCTFSQNLQPSSRESFFRTLSDVGVLETLKVTLAVDDLIIRSSSVDILAYVVENSAPIVREYALEQKDNKCDDKHLFSIIIEQIICDPDPNLGMALRLSSILRHLLDPDTMMLTGISEKEKQDFFRYFYKHCMDDLVAPIIDNTDDSKMLNDDGQLAQLLSIVVELLSFFVEHHDCFISSYIMRGKILYRTLLLMLSKHTFLVLSSLRLLRKIIAQRDVSYNQFIVLRNLFSPVMKAFKRNKGRYNLLDSAIIELFEYIRLEEIQTLNDYIIEDFGNFLDQIDYVQTFKFLRLQYEERREIEEHQSSKKLKTSSTNYLDRFIE